MPTTDSSNPYERAAARLEHASKVYPQLMDFARRVMRDAEEEWNNAQDDLATYEQSPGIPLPEYRPENWPPTVTTWNDPGCPQCGSFGVTTLTTTSNSGITTAVRICSCCSHTLPPPPTR